MYFSWILGGMRVSKISKENKLILERLTESIDWGRPKL
jgi:hypothetical protein